ncbi:MAG: fructose-6-phosphate aldolase [Alphaproteobacteria bacterium]
MDIFLDTADVSEIREMAQTGLIDGVTTNPSLIAKSGRAIRDVLVEICAAVPGPVSAEVTATDTRAMLEEGRFLAGLASNIVVKLPLTWDGLVACKRLTADDIKTNVTLCFSANQALLAAKAGATFISPFIGRIDDSGFDGMALIEDIRLIYDQYPAFDTRILAASVRHPLHVRDAARMGADVVTLPTAVLRSLVKHPLTDKGLEAFLSDWKKTGQSILGAAPSA